MKTVLLTLSFLLFAFTARPSLATSEPVLDVDGDPLLPTRQYYIQPVFRPSGGIILAKTGNQTRPLSVIQGPFLKTGRPVVFRAASEKHSIPVNWPLEIEFAEKPNGVSTARWLLVNDLNETLSVAIGSQIDHQGFKTIEGYFQIYHVQSNFYTLGFTPYESIIHLGLDIGRKFDHEGNIRLVISPGQPYEFMFVKASSEVAKM